jgi:putative flippase GtrA
MKKEFADFIEREQISFRLLLHPAELFRISRKSRLLHFLLTGGTGVAINLLFVWALVHFYFGTRGYFNAYLIGLAFNLAYNFTLYTRVVFKTKRRHASRLVLFSIYSLLMTYLQARLIMLLVPAVGYHYYLIVIGAVIGVFSLCSFFFFKLSLFREKA